MFSESINIDEYEVIEKIGKGSFGKVYKINEKSTGEFFVAKKSQNDKIDLLCLKREIDNMIKLHHPSVLKYVGFSPIDFNHKWKPVIILEYMPNKSLENIINLERSSNSPKDWNDTKKLINLYGIASGMAYIHANNIIHRDLKPDNILMDEYLFPKIGDFGLSKDIQNSKQSKSNVKGTPKYIAPEVYETYTYSFACDVYAFGLIMYEIITNQDFFVNLKYSELLVKISRGERPPIDERTPKAYKDLIVRCWNNDPKKRPTFVEIINELESNPEFILSSIDENEFFNYIDLIRNWKFDVTKEEFFRKRSATFNKIDINEFCINIDQIIDKNNKEQNEDSINEPLHVILMRMADEGDVESMVKYGEMLFEGNEIEQNKEKAIQYFRNASDNGSAKGTLLLADALFNGDGIEESKAEAVILYKSASEKGSLKAAVKYADSIYNGQGIEQNKEIAMQIYKKAAIKGDIEAAVKFANGLYNGDGIRENKELAVIWYKKAADEGDIGAMFTYAVILYKGVDVPEDKHEAARYFTIAANFGHTKSMVNLAYMHYRGDGFPSCNYKESEKYFKMAMDNGDVEAINNYGIFLCERGSNVREKNAEPLFKKAALLFEKAIKLNNIDALNNYANCLYKGIGVDEDKMKAIDLYRIASEKGHAGAMNNYANILMKGKEVKKDEKLAFRYYKEAASKGDPCAAYNYALLLEENRFEPYEREKVKELFRIAANLYGNAAYRYALILKEEGKEKEAQEYFLYAYDNNILEASYFCGKYEYMKSSKKLSFNDGYKYIRDGKENGNARSKMFLNIINLSESCNIF